MLDNILDGTDPANVDCEGEIIAPPQEFGDWVRDNRERIERATANGTLPYFISDNKNMTRQTLLGGNGSHGNGSIIEKNFQDYNSYSDEWEKVFFNNKNGGYVVIHKEHQFSQAKIEVTIDGQKVKAKLTGGEAEKKVGELLCDINAKCVKFLPENGNGVNNPDLEFDNQTWDVKYIPLASEETIRKYFKDARKAGNVIFYSEEERINAIKSAVARELGRYRAMKRDIAELPDVYIILSNGTLQLLKKVK